MFQTTKMEIAPGLTPLTSFQTELETQKDFKFVFNVRNKLEFKNTFLTLIFVAIIQERLQFKSVQYWHKLRLT